MIVYSIYTLEKVGRAMLNFFTELFGNKIFMTGVAGWFVAQLLKTIIHLYVTKEFVLERMVGSGGMPSSHSATVCAVVTAVGFECGVGTPEFAIALIMAIIVMHDARGVRRETGIQAKLLNEMVEVFEKMGRSELSTHDKLKEFVGHTPLQVMAGAILGVLIALVIHI